MTTDEGLATFSKALLQWYDENRRDLPWRRQRDPYAIVVSEVMLQQTQVDTVIAYYDRFLGRFPTVEHLAAASEDDVLTAWKGLGYYRRARNLHRAARQVVEQFGGDVPDTYEGLLQLAGIGPYTAAAVASIAFQRVHAVVDGNVKRIAARLFRIEGPVNTTPVKRHVQTLMDERICRLRPGDFNQAIMELGQTVCTVGQPACHRCPVAAWCASAHQPDAAQLPVRAKARRSRVEARDVFLVMAEGHVLMCQRPATGLLASMWEFPNAPASMEEDITHQWVAALPLRNRRVLGPLKHVFTHLVWQLTVHGVYLARMDDLGDDIQGFTWVSYDDVRDRALPTVMEKVWKMGEGTGPFDAVAERSGDFVTEGDKGRQNEPVPVTIRACSFPKT